MGTRLLKATMSLSEGTQPPPVADKGRVRFFEREVRMSETGGLGGNVPI